MPYSDLRVKTKIIFSHAPTHFIQIHSKAFLLPDHVNVAPDTSFKAEPEDEAYDCPVEA